jgi:TPR repeat protein
MRHVLGWVLLTLVALGPAHAEPASLRAAIAAYNRQDFTTAARLFYALAERGNPQAQSRLGFMYEYGFGVPKNYEAAAWWTTQAAVQADASAQYRLGLMYDKGLGVPQDYVEAYRWLNLSSANAKPIMRGRAARIREAVATKMTVGQLAAAQELSLLSYASPPRWQWRPVPLAP